MECNAIIEANEGYVIKGVNPELYNHVLPNGMTVKEYVENMFLEVGKDGVETIKSM